MGKFIKLNEGNATSVPDVFACGDAVRATGNVTLQHDWLRRHNGERALEVTPLARKHLAELPPSVNAS